MLVVRIDADAVNVFRKGDHVRSSGVLLAKIEHA